MQSLRILVNAIIGSMVPVLNSVLVLVIVTSMYAILGVELYKDLGDGTFDNFFKALFTVSGSFQRFAGCWLLWRLMSILGPSPVRGHCCPYCVCGAETVHGADVPGRHW